MNLNLDGIKKKVADAKNEVKKASAAAAKELKTTREDAEKQMADAKNDLDKGIDDSKLPAPIKKAAKNANSAAYKAAVKQVEKAKKLAKEQVDKAEKKSHEIVGDAAKKAKSVVADAEKYIKGEVKQAKDWLDRVIDDSGMPDWMKDAAKKGVNELEKLANKELSKLKKEADGLIDDLKKNADDLISAVATDARKVLGFEPAKPKQPKQPPKPVPPQREFDHWGGFRFKVEIEQVAAGAFTAVDGLSAEIETVEYQGGMDLYPRQIPGRPKIAPVVLKKGYINTAVLWDWMKKHMDGKTEHKSASIILVADDNDTEVVRYNLFECWPSRWQGFQLDAQSSNAMIEELELQVRHIQRVAA